MPTSTISTACRSAPKVTFPTDEEILALDDELAVEGVPVTDRANQALQRWVRRGEWSGELMPIARYFEDRFRQLHPSVKLGGSPFMFLCASARGISYEYRPPLVFGTVRINPTDSLKISREELQRVWQSSPDEYWELAYQCCDCFDLFQTMMDGSINDAAAMGYASAARDQLQASARQLVAAASDTSLAQACCLAAELAGKAALKERGFMNLKGLGHDLPAIYGELIKHSPAATDRDVLEVTQLMPKYVQVRYSPPSLSVKGAQALYARALFLCSDALRRDARQSIYFGILSDPEIPQRRWQ